MGDTAIEDRSYKFEQSLVRIKSVGKKWGRPSVIEDSATLHQYKQKVMELERKQYLIAGVRDIDTAKNLYLEELAQTLLRITKDLERISEICKELTYEGQEEFIRAMLQTGSGHPLTTLKRHLEPLVDKGHLQVIVGGKGVFYRYELTEKNIQSTGLELIRLNNSNKETLATWQDLAKWSGQLSQSFEKSTINHLPTEVRRSDE